MTTQRHRPLRFPSVWLARGLYCTSSPPFVPPEPWFRILLSAVNPQSVSSAPPVVLSNQILSALTSPPVPFKSPAAVLESPASFLISVSPTAPPSTAVFLQTPTSISLSPYGYPVSMLSFTSSVLKELVATFSRRA